MEYDKNKIKCFKKSVFGYIDGWTPKYFGCLGYPTRAHTEEIQLLMCFFEHSH
jgi:hypothetical protein